MKNKNNIILVPTDFTKVADCALNHAIEMAKIINGEIVLLHVVSKKEEATAAENKINDLTQKTETKYRIKMQSIIKIGNIFDNINDAVSKTRAKLIIMGTHGVKGIQYLTGSYALKVISYSEVPSIIVQERKINQGGYKNIVLPLDLSMESKQKLGLAAEVARYFNSKIHIITPKETDEFFVKRVNSNLIFAKKYLTEHNVEFTTNVAAKKGSSFTKEMLKFASDINADLISIMNLHGAGFTSLFGGNEEQQIITNNAQIPVICINPAKASFKIGY